MVAELRKSARSSHANDPISNVAVTAASDFPLESEKTLAHSSATRQSLTMSQPKKSFSSKANNSVKVFFLDDSMSVFQVQMKSVGRILFDEVCKQLNLLEADYFGLEYQGTDNVWYWLDLEKPVNRQICLSLSDMKMKFCVKFYTPDPSQLLEEYTRYLFCMNIKRDLSLGLLHCNENTAALIASYIVQSECGDFAPEEYLDHTYLSSYKFIPNQTESFQVKIMQNHMKHAGQSPAEADLNVLETARKCELYGIKMHPAKDCEGVILNLSVAHLGILVFQSLTKINTFSWAKIRKISFKRKRFLIKFHTKEYGYYKDVVEFFFDSRNECKNFWKKCVENHSFYRCPFVKHVPRQRKRVLSRGSSFRYSGKTQKEVTDFVKENYVDRHSFVRSTSLRRSTAAAPSHSNSLNACDRAFGSSVSANPMIPLIDADDVTEVNHLDLNSNEITVSSKMTRADVLQQSEEQRVVELVGKRHPIEAASEQQQQTLPSAYTAPEKSTIVVEAAVHDPVRSENELSQPDVNKNTDMTNNKNERKAPASALPKLRVAPVLHSSNMKAVSIRNKADIKKPTYLDDSFYVVIEIFLTEITFIKDLNVIDLWFREEVGKEEPSECCFLLSLITHLAAIHNQFLYDFESRLYGKDGHFINSAGATSHANGIGGNHVSASQAKYEQAIGDVLLNNFKLMRPLYEEFIDNHNLALEQLYESIKSNAYFEKLYNQFENRKVCYLPFTSFVLKPLYRLLQYRALVKRLLKMYGENHVDYVNCAAAFDILESFTLDLKSVLDNSTNFVVLFELQNAINGIQFLNCNQRKFIRLGCLLKSSSHSGDLKHFLFVLMSDILLYLSRQSDSLNFHIKGLMSLKNLKVEDIVSSDGSHSFTICAEKKTLVLSANSSSEKAAWIASIKKAVADYQPIPEIEVNLNLSNYGSVDELNEISQTSFSKIVRSSCKSNRPIYVCWHRSVSITLHDYLRNAETQLCGYLLRRFKANHGWQKLWIVYSNFSLFFYKDSSDDFPLALLPLIGYHVSVPQEDEFANKEFVFELKFRKHSYLFRAESEFSYNRFVFFFQWASLHFP